MFQHTQTNKHTHRAQLEVYVCWGPGQGTQYERAYIYTARLGDARSPSGRLCARPSHIARPILRGYYYSSPLIVTSVSLCLRLSFKLSYRLLFRLSVRPSTSTKLRELPLTLSVCRSWWKRKCEIMCKNSDVDIFSSLSHRWAPKKANVMSGVFLGSAPNQCYLSTSLLPSNSRKWNATLPMHRSLLRHLENVKFSARIGKPSIL